VRHLACPRQPLRYEDFIAGPKEGTVVPPVPPARSGQRRPDLYVAAATAAVVVAGILDRGGVEGVAESLSSRPVVGGSGRGFWRGLTRAGRGGANGSRSGGVFVARRAGAVEQGARFIGDEAPARVVAGARNPAILVVQWRLGAPRCLCSTGGAPRPA